MPVDDKLIAPKFSDDRNRPVMHFHGMKYHSKGFRTNDDFAANKQRFVNCMQSLTLLRIAVECLFESFDRENRLTTRLIEQISSLIIAMQRKPQLFVRDQ